MIYLILTGIVPAYFSSRAKLIRSIFISGSTPWDRADWVRDAKYANFMKYQKRETQKIPDNFKRFTPRMLRGFRRLFDHDERDRAKATDIMKYIKDKWLDSKMSSTKLSFTSLQQISDKDSVMINFSINNNKATKTPVTPEIEKVRTRRLLSSVGLPVDSKELDVDPTQRVNEWLKMCSADPYPVEEPPDQNLPEIVITAAYLDVQRPLTYEQWFLMSNNNNNNQPSEVNKM